MSSPQVTWTPPDGGWGWVVVFCSTLLHAQTAGVLFSMSVMYVEWIETFEESSRGITSWIISISVAVTFLMGPLPAALSGLYGFRVVVFVSGLLTGAGYIISYFATSVTFLMVSIGLVTGLGCCFGYQSAVAVVTVYFSKRRSIAMGAATSGVGIGLLISGPLLNHLINAYGWRGTLLLIGAASFNICVLALLLRPPDKLEICYGDELDHGRKDCKGHEKESLLNKVNQTTRNTDQSEDSISLQTPMMIKSDHGNRPIMLAGDIHISLNNSTRSGIYPQSIFPPCQDQQKVNSLVILQDVQSCNPLLDGNDGFVSRPYASLIELRRNPKQTNLMVRQLYDNIKCQRSMDVLLARSIKHLESISLLGVLPDYQPHIKMDAAKNTKNTDIEIIDNYFMSNKQNDSHYQTQAGWFSSFRTSFTQVIHNNVQLLRDPIFVQLAFSNTATNLAFITPVMYLVDRAVDSGLDKSIGALLIALYGVGNIFGRVLIGVVTYRVFKDCLLNYIIVLMLAGVATTLSCLCGSNGVLHGIYALLIGCFLGGYATLVALATADIMGLEKASASYGLLLVFMGLATLVGPPFAGLLFDWTQSYTLSYVIYGFFLIGSALILVPIYCGQRKRRKKREGIGGS